MKKITIFLASSAELKPERDQFEIAVYRKCKAWFDKGIFLHLDIWEDLPAHMAPSRSQDAYNQVVRSADLFVLLAHTKVGIYTAEEFEHAFGQFQATRKPFIFTYFKPLPAAADLPAADRASLEQFRQKVRELGHFYCSYADFNDLWVQFNRELDRLETAAFAENRRPAESARTITQGDKSVYIEKGGDHTTINIQ